MRKEAPVLKDWFALGFISGAAASVAKSLTNYLLDKVGVPTTRYVNVAGSMVLGKKTGSLSFMKPRPRTGWEWAVGYAADTMLGGLFGVALSYVIAKTPPGHEALKGAVGGGALWVSTFSLGNLLKLEHLAGTSPNKMATLLATNLLYGGIQGMILGKYGTELIQQSHPILVKETGNQAFNRGATNYKNRLGSNSTRGGLRKTREASPADI